MPRLPVALPVATRSDGRRAQRPARPRSALLFAVLGALLALDPPRTRADETKAQESPAAAPAERASLVTQAREDPKAFRELVEAARMYLDLGQEQWRGRSALLDRLLAEATQGRYPLTDLPFLRWMVGQARSFHMDMRESKWRREQNLSEYKTEGPFVHVKSEDFNFTFMLPKSYPARSKDFERYPRPEPFPTVIVLHEKDDYTGKKLPGVHALKRIWPKEQFEGLYDRWIAFVPVAAAGNYTEEDGRIRWEYLSAPFSRFWRHYHVDFDRVILDGGDPALAAAPVLASWFAGIVLRDGTLTGAQKATVRNFAHVPVYVVDKPELAKALQAAGHPDVTLGKPCDLLAWMDARQRTTPRKFQWSVGRVDQVLPYWINVELTDFSAPERTLDVEVVDTKEAPNTVRIAARGIRELALFLNDEVVDLDRAVRVEINGHVVHDEMIKPVTEALYPVKRDLDLLFNRDPVRIRESMYFGWLYPVRLVRLEVPDPKPAAPPEAPAGTGATTPGGGGKGEGTGDAATPAASPEEEQMAARLKEKAQMLIAEGRGADAIPLLKRIVAMPANAQHAWARQQLETLDGGAK